MQIGLQIEKNQQCQLTNRKEKELKEKLLKEQIKGKRTSFSVVKKPQFFRVKKTKLKLKIIRNKKNGRILNFDFL